MKKQATPAAQATQATLAKQIMLPLGEIVYAKRLAARPGYTAQAWRRTGQDSKLGFAVNQDVAVQACKVGDYGRFVIVEESELRWKGIFVRTVQDQFTLDVLCAGRENKLGKTASSSDSSDSDSILGYLG
jgi:hypothetical protein